MKLYRINNGHFYAGVIVNHGYVIKTAPILYRHLFHKAEEAMLAYVKQKEWDVELC